MYLPLGQYSPDVKLGLVSASRNCFPRSLSEERTARLLEELKALGIVPVLPEGRSAIIESKDDAIDAAKQLTQKGCDAVVFYLGNFSPEIEDAFFVKNFENPVLMIAAAEENAAGLLGKRGDALCGLLSATMGVAKRGLKNRVIIPENPLVDAKRGAKEIARFIKIARVIKGIRNATIGLFGPRPRDFETCNYNVSSLLSIGVEVEEHGLFDLHAEIENVRKSQTGEAAKLADEMCSVEGVKEGSAGTLASKMSVYEQALRNMRDKMKLSGISTQCWTNQEAVCKHVPCFVNSRLTELGCPLACENDAYSLTAELFCQYASDEAVTMLDINHSIPTDLDPSLKNYPAEDLVGLFHCGNTAKKLMKNAAVNYQRIMASTAPSDVDYWGTLEGQIKGSPITVFQIHGSGDKLRAYICEGEFLDLDPKTFGSTGTAYIPGFMRFYRHCLLGRFHHHAAIAFTHCGDILFDALKALGVEEIYVPSKNPYPGENVFAK